MTVLDSTLLIDAWLDMAVSPCTEVICDMPNNGKGAACDKAACKNLRALRVACRK